jgi:hypothetical protein
MDAAVAQGSVPVETPKAPPATENGAAPAVEARAEAKRPATRKRTATGVAPAKAPATKRRRAVAPKKTAAAKPTPKKKTAAKPAVEDAAVSSESDSDDDDDDDDEEEVETESSAASASSSTSDDDDDDDALTNGTTAADILHQPRRQMTDSAIDELVPLILKNESSVNAQVVLSRYFHKKGVNEANVCTLLGVTREQIDGADCIAVVTHGPHTEEIRTARLIYDNSSIDNYHWSLVCWFRSVPSTCFHYDSMPKVNDRRCREVVSVFRRLGVFPKDVNGITVPDFFPEQEQEWECGYELLVALSIIAGKRTAIAPITDDDVQITYDTFFSTLATGGLQATFLRRLRELLARENYASWAPPFQSETPPPPKKHILERYAFPLL